ncbi:MAG: bifunctional phosphopantothenoylcysteine decarboxylase/phosphopantothenate--cysteine ligase CoaBC, partial [Acidobacteria bacterium]|nr:bifunctional phosphopantothenoylcysteine decarboxylase/phosphopantothenate--cysteine ligase CoaBC [Acidobacteriota bacterium]
MRVILGIGGGIAAYKVAELARALEEHGIAVQVVMTRAAQEFVRPLTFAALTGRKVITGMFASDASGEVLSSAVEHIRVAQESALMVVAPATADLLAKFAHGLADDFLSTLYLAFTGTVVLAPAMNTNMWLHPATQANLETLRARGHRIVDPEDGPLACGTSGPGRLADPRRIAALVAGLAGGRRDLEGETVLVTAGPTQEPIDPVRFLSNRSSGKMGYALAEAAAARGARVVLVSGPVSLAAPAGVELVRVRTAGEMRAAVMERLEPASIVVKAAAVADYHGPHSPGKKIKKTAARITLELDPTPDILAEVGRNKGGRLLIGFAAET